MRYIDADGTRFVENNDFDSLKKWVESGCDINHCRDNSYPALTVAALRGRADMARYLIQQGADVDRQDDFGQTALLVAVEYQEIEVVRTLIENGADVNAIGRFGMTPLLYASNPNNQRGRGYSLTEDEKEERRINIARLLLDAGADIHLSSDKLQTTPLQSAKKINYTAMVDLLLKNNH